MADRDEVIFVLFLKGFSYVQRRIKQEDRWLREDGGGGGSVNIYSNKYKLVDTFYITSRSPLYCSTPCVFFILMLRCSFQQE